MSALEHYAPLVNLDDTPHNLSSRLLLNEFRQFAFNNQAFRAGLIDNILIKTLGGDELEPDVVPTDEISVGYEFEASRVKESDRPNRPELSFSLSMIGIRDAIEIPAHIAMQYYGCDDAEEAVAQAGMGALEHEKRFTITNRNRTLVTCDSYIYKDDEGNIISHACSCPDEEETEVALYIIGEDGAEDQATMLPHTTAYIESDSNFPSESLGINDVEEMTNIWAALAEFEADFTSKDAAQAYDRNLAEAYHSFQLFKQGLRRQLGL